MSKARQLPGFVFCRIPRSNPGGGCCSASTDIQGLPPGRPQLAILLTLENFQRRIRAEKAERLLVENRYSHNRPTRDGRAVRGSTASNKAYLTFHTTGHWKVTGLNGLEHRRLERQRHFALPPFILPRRKNGADDSRRPLTERRYS